MSYRSIPQNGPLVYVVTRADYVMGVASSLEQAKGLADLYRPVTWKQQHLKLATDLEEMGDLTLALQVRHKWKGEDAEGFEFEINAIPLGGYTPGTTAGKDGYDLYAVKDGE